MGSASRLDRLLKLLESGGSATIKKAAAIQIGELLKSGSQDSDLSRLLHQIYEYLRHPEWDTRSAASWTLDELTNKSSSTSSSINDLGDVENQGQLSFENFDLNQVLSKGTVLLGSSGKEYDEMLRELAKMSSKDRIVAMRSNLMQRIGIGGQFMENIVGEEDDIIISPKEIQEQNSKEKEDLYEGLSARERMKLKRKNRMSKKIDTSASLTAVAKEEQAKKKVKVEEPSEEQQLLQESFSQSSGWPFENIYEDLCFDLLDPNWPIRHGATLGLRVLVQNQFNEIGEKNIEDLLIRLICLLALDRFGDYVGDQVVAPVREACGQALGLVFLRAPQALATKTIEALIQMCLSQTWEARHAGLVGLKYCMAVRKDLVALFLEQTYSILLNALQDTDDDVRCVSAECFLPIAVNVVTYLDAKEGAISGFLRALLGSLANLDDLSVSTVHVLALLECLLSMEKVLHVLQAGELDLTEYLNLLFPFIDHSNQVVRKTVLDTLIQLQNNKNLTIFGKKVELLHGLLQKIMERFFKESEEYLVHLLRDLIDALSMSQLISNSETQNFLFKFAKQFLSAVVMPLDVRSIPLAEGKDVESLDVRVFGEQTVLHGRVSCCHALAVIMQKINDAQSVKGLESIMLQKLRVDSSLEILLCCIILEKYISNCPPCSSFDFTVLQENLSNILADSASKTFIEHSPYLLRLRSDTVSFLASIGLSTNQVKIEPFSPKVVENLISMEFPVSLNIPADLLTSSREKLLLNLKFYESRISNYSLQSALASCFVFSIQGIPDLPPKLNPFIKAFMNSLKFERNSLLQERSSLAMVQLLNLLVQAGKNPVVDKILQNAKSLLLANSSETPSYCETELCTGKDSIFTVKKMQEEAALREISANVKKKMLKKAGDLAGDLTGKEMDSLELDENKTTQRGAQMLFRSIVTCFKDGCFNKFPAICKTVLDSIINKNQPNPNGVIETIELLSSIIPSLSLSDILDMTEKPVGSGTLLDHLFVLLESPENLVRHSVSKCLSHLINATEETCLLVMENLIRKLVPALEDHSLEFSRLGTCELLYYICQNTGLEKLLPFMGFLIIPIMRRMSDPHADVRFICSLSFSKLVQVLPLEAGCKDPKSLPEDLCKMRVTTRKRFLCQLLDRSRLDAFQLPVKIGNDTVLRPYQQLGVDWMAFLNKFGLHGILCDDMGLGKTLQTLCIVASEHHQRSRGLTLSDCFYDNGDQPLPVTMDKTSKASPSLIICPPSVMGHWMHEIEFYFGHELKPLLYAGIPSERRKLDWKGKNVIVSCYEVIRNDIDYLKDFQFNYVVLDEGHLIKNSKTKLSEAIRRLKAMHRLILSGTPIQNRVLELWSLMEFLMPGYLSTEKEFTSKYAKPIAQSRDAKSSSSEQEAGAKALDSLHKQVLPFLLRRMKEDVLNDLPPKIIQDYYCEMTELQKRLYEKMGSVDNNLLDSMYKGLLEDQQDGDMAAPLSSSTSNGKNGGKHVFQALQEMRKICNHPIFAMGKEVAREFEEVKNLAGMEHSGKLVALQELLQELGFPCNSGASGDAEISDFSADDLDSASSANHRVLIFCQVKSMLDLIESSVLRVYFPDLKFRRMDGTTPPLKRQELVREFNGDSSIDALLLTTSTGGLGLNLTGADTVIFVEQDWNPMKDLQAMDRAHRLGQKRTVHVYRILTRGTIEESIMGLQKFKVAVAGTVVGQQKIGDDLEQNQHVLDVFGDNNSNSATLTSGATAAGQKKSGKLSMAEVLSDAAATLSANSEAEYGDFDIQAYLQSTRTQNP